MTAASLDARKNFYGTVFGTWAIIAVYAILHDQIVVRIEPEHFTVYHPNPLGIEHAGLLAAWLGFLASVTPGLLLGVALYLVGRWGVRPKRDTRKLLRSVILLVAVTEVCSLVSLAFTMLTGVRLYPAGVYPATGGVGILYTQTMQLTAYLVGAFGSLILLGRVWIRRASGQP